MRLFEVIKIGGKKNITEGISPVVYHYMPIRDAENVLKQNKFRLTASAGTGAEKALQKGDRMYYLSTTRHKLGGYHIDNSWMGVIFELDGSKLSQNYAGKAVDYWGAEWYGDPGDDKKGREKKEAEDRIYSYKPYIENANKYIKSVHVLYDAEAQKRYDQLAIDVRRIYISAKRLGVRPYLYTNKQDWLVQDTRKAVNPSSLEVVAKATGLGKDKRKTYGSGNYDRRNLSPWIELYQAPVGANISKAAEKTRYNYVLYGYGDAAQSFAADIHNAKSKPADETGLDTLLKIFRKEKIKSPQEYLDLLKKKWSPKAESISEYKDVSQDSDEGEASLTGYVVNTDEDQLVNYFQLEHGVSEDVINTIRATYKTIAVARNMHVDEDYRGQGHGTKIMDEFIEAAIDNGAQAILTIADTAEDNEFDLVEWYKRLGFEIVAQTGEGPFMVMEL